jgi:hypothetical protein
LFERDHQRQRGSQVQNQLFQGVAALPIVLHYAPIDVLSGFKGQLVLTDLPHFHLQVLADQEQDPAADQNQCLHVGDVQSAVHLVCAESDA